MQYPREFVERMTRLCGDEWRAGETPVYRGLRVNTLKASVEAVLPHIPSATPLAFSPYGFAVDAAWKVGGEPLHHAGAYYMQEPSAMSAVTVLAPRRGERILDVCAAPGGKSTQIAAALGGEGLLWCNEYVGARARILMQNLERCGVTNAVVTSLDVARLCRPLRGFFDAVLVDAPCSGEGMFRKEPDALAMWSVENIRLCARRAADILDAASGAVRAGGRLVFSTCTFAPEENECQVARFLKHHPDFELVPIDVPFGRAGFSAEAVAAFDDEAATAADLTMTRRIFPSDGGEGHFIAAFRRKGDTPLADWPTWKEENGAKAVREALLTWCERVPTGVLRRFGDRWRLLPPQMPRIDELPVLYAGVACAEERPGRLEPTHAWFAAYGYLARQKLELSDEACRRFLRGESVPADCRGYAAVTVGGVPLGFGKADGKQLKNHYPKGLRTRTG